MSVRHSVDFRSSQREHPHLPPCRTACRKAPSNFVCFDSSMRHPGAMHGAVPTRDLQPLLVPAAHTPTFTHQFLFPIQHQPIVAVAQHLCLFTCVFLRPHAAVHEHCPPSEQPKHPSDNPSVCCDDTLSNKQWQPHSTAPHCFHLSKLPAPCSQCAMH
jgi:hypothetical protein